MKSEIGVDRQAFVEIAVYTPQAGAKPINESLRDRNSPFDKTTIIIAEHLVIRNSIMRRDVSHSSI